MANRLTTDGIKDGIFKKNESARNKKRSNDQNNNRGRDDRNKWQKTGRNFALTAPDQGQVQLYLSSCYLFRNLFSSTTIGDENPIRTLGDYSKPSHEGYRNTIELPAGNNVVPLRSDTIRLVQNGCSFHEIRSEDPNQHLKDFLKLVDSLDLDGENRERTRLCLFQFSLYDQAGNWLERLPTGSISTWEDLTTRFLA
ncbi:hypothetical protein Tco_0751497 [Tanacetum coccineum]|uniref:MAK10-like protein n=1 Tax=Tanacetum coccineum TaxID=301880 RepID=A0ABQ4Z5T1_9ASTR